MFHRYEIKGYARLYSVGTRRDLKGVRGIFTRISQKAPSSELSDSEGMNGQRAANMMPNGATFSKYL